MKRFAVTLALAASSLSASALPIAAVAQSTRVVTIQQIGYAGEEAVVIESESAPFEAQSDPENEKQKEKTPKKPSQRLEKLKKLDYDRRPSVIFAAWSTPPKTAEPAPGASAGELGASAVEPVASEPASGAAEPAPAPSGEAQPAPAEGAAASAPAEPSKEEKAQRKAAEEEAKRKEKEAEAARKQAEEKALAAELETLQLNVTLGNWAAVRAYFAGLDPDEWAGGYQRLLESLASAPTKRPPDVHPQGQQFLEKNRFAPADVLGLAAAGPRPLTKEQMELLGKILAQAIEQGHRLERMLAELAPGLDAPDAPLSRRALALVLVAAEQPLFLERLLPSAEEAEAAGDREAFNLISRLCLAKHAQEGKTAWLEEAWRATLAALATGEVDAATKEEAIQRAVEIAPQLKVSLGQAWLDESFTLRPERGREVLAAIGSASSKALQRAPTDQDRRRRLLELQRTAAEALLTAAPERADEWAAELALLASNWLREAQWTYANDRSSALGPRMERDPWGNVYWYDESGMQRGGVPAIPTARVIELRPSDGWMARVDDTLRPRLHGILAQLLLKVSEEAQAFPHIEFVAATHPREAEALVAEFLRVWARNNNPNESASRRNRFVYSYGFDDRAGSIPLTRSQQERNLSELAQWVVRLRQLPVELPELVLTEAFTAAHSQAEIYRLETIEAVFGPLDELEPATLAALVERMRTNLTTVWNDPAVQETKKTKRGQKDIQAEVLRGYALTRATVERALVAHASSWKLLLAQAALAHDENDYRHEIEKDPEFSARRAEALAEFARAAEAYAAAAPALEKDDQSSAVYDTWFYAALGACDLRALDHRRQLAAGEIARVSAALHGLPGELAERHVELFANSLVTRMGSVNPAVKQRYVREGLEITGDIELVRDVRRVHEYYADLVTEIQLRATVDGSSRVGHAAPFGLRIDLRHTRDIERESGGFAKYLQNQNNTGYSFNYGRPTEDYRDKFEEAARAALAEHFDVRSVTFNEPAVRSRADAEYGWRVTPYAYLLLTPRGAQVDRIPQLRLDLDFLDSTGYVVLPVESPIVPIDATDAAGDERPAASIALTQILDERQAKDQRLVLELKATANGLVPELEELVDLDPEGFDVTKREDTGVAITKFAEEGEGVLSERTWTVTLQAKPGQTELPTSFRFAAVRIDVASNERFRYVDADLEPVGELVTLERRYGEPSRAWIAWTAAGAVLVGLAIWAWIRWRPRRVRVEQRWRVPEPLTPFTVLGLLRDIQLHDGLAPESKRELGAQIARVERHYFGVEADQPLDLRDIAESWTARAS